MTITLAPVHGLRDIIAACGERGFHSGHVGVEGAEGVVYERSSHVLLDKTLAVTVVDLR